MGSSTEHSAYGPTRNPWDLDPDPGRLRRRLGGRARGVRGAAGDRHRHRRLDPPAGRGHRHGRGEADLRRRCRRYGLVALASSLDQAGPVRPHRARRRPAARGHGRARPDGLHQPDRARTPTSWPRPGRRATSRRACASASSASCPARATRPASCARFEEAVEVLVDAGAKVVEVSLPELHRGARRLLPDPARARRAATWPSSTPCATACGSSPTGVADPTAEQVMAATRAAGFGDEVKRRIILGTYALSSGYYDAYYGSAQKVRTLIQRDFAAAFGEADVLVSPTVADDGLPARRQARRPAGDVPQRRRDDPGEPGRRPRDVAAQRAGRRGRPAGRHPDPRARAAPTTGCTGSGRALEALLAARWGGPLLDRVPDLSAALATANGATR